MSDTATSPTPLLLAGATPAEARKLIAAGWQPTDTGLWSDGASDPCDAAVALRVAARAPKAPSQATTAVTSLWNHIAGTVKGTAGMSILASVVAAVIANPPPEMGLSPAVITWVKWALPILGAVLLGSQVPQSMKAVKSDAKE